MGRGEKFSVNYMKNKGRVSKFLKLNKRVYPFIRHLRVCNVLAVFLKRTLQLFLCILESSWVDSFPLEVSPAALALRLARYAARSVLRASKYQVEMQKEILIKKYPIIALICL
jgi:hypothetical protein